MLTQAKQVAKLLYAPVRVSGFTATAATSDVVTTAVTTALGTAGDGGVAVPLAVATATAAGVVTTGNNRVEVYNATTQEKISIAGNEIYARITEAAGVYTLSYFSVVAGVETATTLDSAYTLDFEFPYQFTFVTYPREAAVAIKARNVSDDPKSAAKPFYETVAVTATNTLAALTATPVDLTQVKMTVNGQTLYAPLHFTVVGTAVTVNAGTIGYNIETTDLVYVEYLKY